MTLSSAIVPMLPLVLVTVLFRTDISSGRLPAAGVAEDHWAAIHFPRRCPRIPGTGPTIGRGQILGPSPSPVGRAMGLAWVPTWHTGHSLSSSSQQPQLPNRVYVQTPTKVYYPFNRV